MKLEVSIGEMVDKMTILKIKSERISDADKMVFIERELKLILDMLEPLQAEYPELSIYVNELYDVNSSLWDIEDSIREKETHQSFDDEFISLARNVYKTNDIRAKIKHDINIYTNSNLREVKQYK